MSRVEEGAWERLENWLRLIGLSPDEVMDACVDYQNRRELEKAHEEKEREDSARQLALFA